MDLIPIQTHHHGVTSDAHLLQMWLHDLSPGTQKTYLQSVNEFGRMLGERLLTQVTVADIGSYIQTLGEVKTTTRRKKIAAIRSLFSYGHKLGYFQWNVGAPIRLPRVEDELASKLLTEEQVFRLVNMETDPRNHLILRLIYHSGMRAAEICGLRWADVQPRPDLSDASGQIIVHGKGSKVRTVLIGKGMWQELMDWQVFSTRVRQVTPQDRVLFSERSRKLDYTMVWRVVKRAAKRAGLPSMVTVHTLRHAHVSHALKRNVPLWIVKDTVGHASITMTDHYNQVAPDQSSSTSLMM